MDKQADKKKTDSDAGIFRLLVRKQAAEDVASINCQASVSGNSRVNSDGGILMSSSEDYMRDDSSLLSLQPWIFKKGSGQGDNIEHFDRGGFNFDGSELSPRSVSIGRTLERNRSSLRSRRYRRSNLKPLTSVQNSLIPPLYSEHFEIEEFAFTPVSSPRAPKWRPFVVTDGNKVISKSSYDSSAAMEDHEGDSEICSQEQESVIGIPRLPESRVSKRKKRELQQAKSDDSERDSKVSFSQGSLDGKFLFFLGISVGMISTFLSGKKELEKLTGKLKQTETLVQDLKEELEMNDSLTIKELFNNKSDLFGQEIALTNMNISTNTSENHGLIFPDQGGGDDTDKSKLSTAIHESESMSKIEVELQAELERLELNMNFSNIERKMSMYCEFDPELEAEVVRGDLRADMLAPESRNCQVDRESSSESTPTPHRNVNYAVCPKELSLRLYELIESRLEERIRDLERTLGESEKQIQLMESERVSSHRTLSTSYFGSSSNQGSPVVVERDGGSVQPLCLNLSGDALSAYNEAYEAFTRISDAQEENPPLSTASQSLIWDLEGSDLNKSLTNTTTLKKVPTWEQVLISRECKDIPTDDSDDEEEKLLIKQLVEKNKTGFSCIYACSKNAIFDG